MYNPDFYNYAWMYGKHGVCCIIYNGEQIWAYYEDFKPVRELSEDDIYAYEYYNKNNVDKFKAFVAPAYKGTK